MSLVARTILAALALLGTAASWADPPGYDLSGEVVNPAGAPVPGATVWVVRDGQVRTSATAENGRFRFDRVPPGPMRLVAHAPGRAFGGREGWVIGPDDTVRVVLPEPVSLDVRVVDQHFEPVAGARVKQVRVAQAYTIPVDDLPASALAPLRTDADGRVTVPALPPDSYVALTIGHRDYADAFFPLDSGVATQTVQVYPGTPLRGRVTGPSGAGVAGARVGVYSARLRGSSAPQVVETGPEGFYKAVVRPGPHVVRAQHPDFAPAQPVAVNVVPRSENIADLALPEAHTVTGTVRTETGEAAPGMWVEYRIDGVVSARSRTVSDGTYRLTVRAGSGTLRVVPPPRHMVARRSGEHLVPAFDTQVAVEQERAVTVPPMYLVPLPEVRGAVVDADGEPAAHAVVSSLDLHPARWFKADENGEFTIGLDRIPPEARATFIARHARRFQQQRFEVDFESVEPVSVALERYRPALEPDDPARAPNDLALLAGEPAPAWRCQAWFNTEPLTLEDLRGSVVVLTFWAGFADAGPAAEHMNQLRVLRAALADADDVVFIIIHDSSVAQDMARAYVEQAGLDMPVGFDTDMAETFDLYDITVIPQTVLIDKDGVLRHYDTGGRLLDLIKSLRRES
jgi:peroxiredoxin